MSDTANDETAPLNSISQGLREGRWSAATSIAAIAATVDDAAKDPVRLQQSLNSYALAHVATLGRDVSTIQFTNQGGGVDPLHRQWRVVVQSEPARNIGRWISAVEEIAPNAEIVVWGKPLLYGDFDSFRRLSSAIHLALATHPVSETEHREISELLAKIDNWLDEVGPS